MDASAPDGSCQNKCVEYADGTWGFEFDADCIACYTKGFVYYENHRGCGPPLMDESTARTYFDEEMQACQGNFNWPPGQDPFINEMVAAFGENLGRDIDLKDPDNSSGFAEIDETMNMIENQLDEVMKDINLPNMKRPMDQISQNFPPALPNSTSSHACGYKDNCGCSCKKQKKEWSCEPKKVYTEAEKAAYKKKLCEIKKFCYDNKGCSYRRKSKPKTTPKKTYTCTEHKAWANQYYSKKWTGKERNDKIKAYLKRHGCS